MHVKVVHADSTLDGAASLLKPAILYADKVTVYSPAASMFESVREFAALSDPWEQMAALRGIIQDVPRLAPELNVDDETMAHLRTFLAADPQAVRRHGRRIGARREIDEVYGHLANLRRLWDQEMPDVVERVKGATGAGELLAAVDGRAVEVADITTATSSGAIGAWVRGATSDAPPEDRLDDLVLGFASRVLEILTQPTAFPLLDAQSSGLVRALESEAGFRSPQQVMRRGSEISAAAKFMGYMPYFPDLPMDEVLDLRRSLRKPLVRFRSATASMSQEFSSRPIDEDFGAEVEDAWRRQVEPALAEIRESLAEHGLLREVASIALGDPRRLIAEAGGVLVAAQSEIVSLSGLMVSCAAASVPTADVVGRAAKKAIEARRDVRKHSFYFLHRLGSEAARRSA